MTAASELTALVAPLVDALGSPERADRLLRELGVLTAPGVPAAVPPALADLAQAAQGALDALADLDDEDQSLAERLVTLATAMADLFQAVTALSTVDPEGLAAPYDSAELWPLLADALPAYLMVRWLRDHHRTALDTLALLGVVGQPDRGVPTVDFARLVEVAGNPSEAVSSVPAGDLVAPLRRLLDAKGVTASTQGVFVDGDHTAWVGSGTSTSDRVDLSFPLEAGVPGLAVSVEALADGVAVSMAGEGLVDLGDGWSLEPSGTGLALTGRPATPMVLVGGAGTTRIELASIDVGIASGSPTAGSEVEISVGTQGLRLVIVPGDGDSFIAAVLGAAEISADLPFSALWSPTGGFTVDGAAGLEIRVAVSFTIGPLTLNGLTIGLVVAGTDSVALEIVTEIGGRLGPVTAVVTGMGLRIELRPDDSGGGARLGPWYLSVAFRPPTGVGVAVETAVASGGGFLYLDAPAGEYAGVLDVEVLGVGISAFGLIDTKAPGVDGWSLFFALFLDLPSIPLGFGFTLNGVGGLAGINRTLDTAALESAVRSGGIDAVLFPPDPIADAPFIIEQLGAMFPPANDRYVFGPVVKIGWGAPTLVEAELGIVVSLPDPVTIAILGSVSAVLPVEELGLVVLHLDVAGVVDAAAGTLAINASLHDSSIVGFALAGDMALRSSFGEHPTFLMALGGFHPAFDAPDGFPLLHRLSLGISAPPVLEIHFESYFAITSNSVQFGAAFGLSAEIAGFGIEGGTEFDALVYFSPFMVMTDLGFHVVIKAANIDLAGVWLDAHVEGPNPWYVIGTARFKILGIEEEIRVDERIGGHQAEPTIPATDLRTQVLDALATPEAWVAVATTSPGVLLAGSSTVDGELLAMPDGRVTVSQRVAPLGVTVNKAGDAPVADYDHFTVEPAAGSLARTADVRDWFAPGYFFELGATEQLSAPSFEKLLAGIEMGGGGPVAGEPREASLDFEAILRDPELGEDRVELGVFPLDADLREAVRQAIPGCHATGSPGFTAASSFTVAADEEPIQVASVDYAVTHKLSGDSLLLAATWSGAHQSEPAGRTSTVVVPTWETRK